MELPAYVEWNFYDYENVVFNRVLANPGALLGLLPACSATPLSESVLKRLATTDPLTGGSTAGTSWS